MNRHSCIVALSFILASVSHAQVAAPSPNQLRSDYPLAESVIGCTTSSSFQLPDGLPAAPPQPTTTIMPKKPSLNPELVNEFVNVAHSDFVRVKELLEQEPALINASWDWGGGDWETALGAAAHMGKAEIAIYLIDRGARMDIFAAAMLGRLDIVQAVAAIQPAALTAPGPHGISLLSHAKKGGKNAAAVVEFLKAT